AGARRRSVALLLRSRGDRGRNGRCEAGGAGESGSVQPRRDIRRAHKAGGAVLPGSDGLAGRPTTAGEFGAFRWAIRRSAAEVPGPFGGGGTGSGNGKGVRADVAAGSARGAAEL